MMRRMFCIFMVLMLPLLHIPSASAQQGSVVVPNLTGLNIPEAAALLNAIGLRFGVEQVTVWTQTSSQPPNIISSQSIQANTSVERGTTVDVGTLRPANMKLIYDDNDLTMVNLTQNVVDVAGVRFTSTEGTSTSYSATRWASNLRSRQCMQVWTVPRNGPKGVEECQFIQNFLTDTQPGEHFWTQSNGVQSFVVLEDGVERVTCPAADTSNQDNPLQCEFYLDGANAAQDITEYLYFAYTTDAITIINQSTDKWMPTGRTPIINNNPALSEDGIEFTFGDPAVFLNPETIIGDVTQLAPGQCIMLTTNHPDGLDTPPQPCFVIAQRDLAETAAFWLWNFDVDSATDGQRRQCPQATPDRPTLCIIPQ